MNQLVQLKGRLYSRARSNATFGPPSLPAGSCVYAEDLLCRATELENVRDYWKDSTALNQPLVTVLYKRVIAKSNRLTRMMSTTGKNANADDTIVGARFVGIEKKKHLMTHCVPMESIEVSIRELRLCSSIIQEIFHGKVLPEDIAKGGIIDRVQFKSYELARSAFTRLVVETSFVEAFGVQRTYEGEQPDENILATIYKTDIAGNAMLESVGINPNTVLSYDDTTFLLNPEQFRLLVSRAPYLVAMSMKDFGTIEPLEPKEEVWQYRTIESPGDQPVIGVIDTLFDDRVYFSDWVKSFDCVDPAIRNPSDERAHATAVCSIIVDGPSLNPMFDDGCGHFRVRHFGVTNSHRFSSFSIMKSIQTIVESNQDIKVWNLSLGATLETSENFISPEAAILDELQNKYDVCFVVAGTNDKQHRMTKRIGAPADSINSLVVNSVTIGGMPANYTRVGPVLSFHCKPDICYYGGSDELLINTYPAPAHELPQSGTSLAAPWISRKLAYLIQVLGMSREVAKALLIDSAAGWSSPKDTTRMGYGTVPIHISDVINCKDNEIRFYIEGTSDKFDTYTYGIPVPIFKGKQPYNARATLCYFPPCSRNQGVDYTSSELSLTIGRMHGEKIDSVNNDKQDETESFVYEEDARNHYRKWDNVKHVAERIMERGRPRKLYEQSGHWGISVKRKERLSNRQGRGMHFGIVVTLRAMDGQNRLDSFIRSCFTLGWLVTPIDVQTRVNIFNESEVEVTFDE